MERDDPYYKPVNSDLDVWQQILGIRYDLTNNSSIKLEMGFGRRQARKAGGTVSQESLITTTLQLSWGF